MIIQEGTTFGQCGIRTHDLWLRRLKKLGILEKIFVYEIVNYYDPTLFQASHKQYGEILLIFLEATLVLIYLLHR
jgi:hypothetical protein